MDASCAVVNASRSHHTHVLCCSLTVSGFSDTSHRASSLVRQHGRQVSVPFVVRGRTSDGSAGRWALPPGREACQQVRVCLDCNLTTLPLRFPGPERRSKRRRGRSFSYGRFVHWMPLHSPHLSRPHLRLRPPPTHRRRRRRHRPLPEPTLVFGKAASGPSQSLSGLREREGRRGRGRGRGVGSGMCGGGGRDAGCVPIRHGKAGGLP